MSFITKKLEEFDEEFKLTDYDCVMIKIRQFLSTALDEMIKEVEEMLPEENYGHEDNCSTEYKNGWNDCREEIKQSISSLREGNK